MREISFSMARDLNISFPLDAREHLGDLFFERDDLFLDRPRFELVRFDDSKIRLERIPRARHGVTFPPG